VLALRSFAVAWTLVALTGCGGAAANSEWVREPEGGGSLAGGESLTLEHDGTVSTTSDSAPTSGPQRLDHTVTLGSVIATPPDPAAPGAPPPASVVVNVNNYGGGYGSGAYYGYGYAPYFAGSRPSGGAPPHASTLPSGGGSGSMQPGQSWPAAPSYGPSFPYHLSPASPWETKR
jgi:hypothetical protein